MARDFGSAESTEIAGILCVFPNFGTARMGQKTRHPAVAELFRGSLVARSGGADGLRDEGLLESAINTPLQTFGGQELYPTVLEKAARLGYGLIHNHPFLDGNKRIGTHAMLVFLDINNITLSYEDDDLIAMILRVASGEMDDSQLLEWLKTHIE